ncbi:MAG: response regulator transcription factor [Blastocatellia bacterium]
MMSLLIVEDNAKMRRMLKSLVADLASPIHECDDGAYALAIYAAQQPDWVLMDIGMKRMDGIAATREVKALYPDAKIIIVTGYNEADLREAAREAGACGYVLKDNLLAILELIGNPHFYVRPDNQQPATLKETPQ